MTKQTDAYDTARFRADNACEAMLEITQDLNADGSENVVWTRCGKSPAEVHHKLTRARGGELLDELGESYHLMLLCHKHHMGAHDLAKAFDAGLLIHGEFFSGNYYGPDEYLQATYGPERTA